MKKVRINYKFIRMIIVILFITVTVHGKKQERTSDYLSFPKALENLLYKGETVIDFTFDETFLYALVSREGSHKYGDLFVLFQHNGSESWERIYENDFSELKPWKIETADIDQDDIKEILIAVRKTTRYDKTVKNRMFIFNMNNNKLVKKWTGSQISGVWNSFFLSDIAPMPGEELIFVEELGEGKQRVNVYYWFDFGFVLLAYGEVPGYIQNITFPDKNNIMITYWEDSHNRDAVFTVESGKLIEKRNK